MTLNQAKARLLIIPNLDFQSMLGLEIANISWEIALLEHYTGAVIPRDELIKLAFFAIMAEDIIHSSNIPDLTDEALNLLIHSKNQYTTPEHRELNLRALNSLTDITTP